LFLLTTLHGELPVQLVIVEAELCLEGFLSLQGISLLQPSGEVVDMIMVEFLEG